jgi:hypothetical protein
VWRRIAIVPRFLNLTLMGALLISLLPRPTFLLRGREWQLLKTEVEPWTPD